MFKKEFFEFKRGYLDKRRLSEFVIERTLELFDIGDDSTCYNCCEK